MVGEVTLVVGVRADDAVRSAARLMLALRPLVTPCASIAGETSNRFSFLASRKTTGRLDVSV